MSIRNRQRSIGESNRAYQQYTLYQLRQEFFRFCKRCLADRRPVTATSPGTWKEHYRNTKKERKKKKNIAYVLRFFEEKNKQGQQSARKPVPAGAKVGTSPSSERKDRNATFAWITAKLFWLAERGRSLLPSVRHPEQRKFADVVSRIRSEQKVKHTSQARPGRARQLKQAPHIVPDTATKTSVDVPPSNQQPAVPQKQSGAADSQEQKQRLKNLLEEEINRDKKIVL